MSGESLPCGSLMLRGCAARRKACEQGEKGKAKAKAKSAPKAGEVERLRPPNRRGAVRSLDRISASRAGPRARGRASASSSCFPMCRVSLQGLTVHGVVCVTPGEAERYPILECILGSVRQGQLSVGCLRGVGVSRGVDGMSMMGVVRGRSEVRFAECLPEHGR